MVNFKKLVKDEAGQGLVEYALIIALIAVIAIVAVRALGGSISGLFTKTSNQLDTATP